MEFKCDNCGRVFNRKPSCLRKQNFCSKTCRHEALNVVRCCENCGKIVIRNKSQAGKHVFCCRECAKKYLSGKMTMMNILLNPERMTDLAKEKLRMAGLRRGQGKSYRKIHGKHEHRVIAEKILNRPLKKGEVVHHIDGNKRNNTPLNLMVFPSQKEHGRWHNNEKYNPAKNYE